MINGDLNLLRSTEPPDVGQVKIFFLPLSGEGMGAAAEHLCSDEGATKEFLADVGLTPENIGSALASIRATRAATLRVSFEEKDLAVF